MSERLELLGALVRPKIEEMKGKIGFWMGDSATQGLPTPSESTWAPKNALTLEKFLEINPVPKDPNDIVMYGIAWEFIWGEPAPQVVTEAREKLLLKARDGADLSRLENLWLNLMMVDTDYF